MEGFVRIIPKQSCENWLMKLSQMGFLFHEAEYEMVKKGLRRAAVIHIYPERLGESLERINKDNLVFTPILKSGCYEGFAHKHKEVKPGDPFYWYGALTKEEKDGQKFKQAELSGDHRTIGLMLGYPQCCVEYFIKNFPVNYDPIWLGKEGKVRGYSECNQMLRYFGARITSHLSCSPNCQATRRVGQLWFKTMKEIDKEKAAELYDLLSGEIIWNSYHGVVQVETPYFVGLTHTSPLLEKPRIIEWRGRTKKEALRLRRKKPKIIKKKR